MDYMTFAAPPSRPQKRSRDEDQDEESSFLAQFGKKARHSVGNSSDNSWPPRDSVISTPTVWHKPKYDSDDQSSMMSEPGSPQQLENSSGEDEEMEDVDMAAFSSPSSLTETGAFANTSPRPGMGIWHSRSYSNRSATPIRPPSPSPTFRTAIKQHIRHRHPQEHLSSSDHLEIPSSIDEDEVATPPSAAEAAGSQLSMLSVSDMDVEPSADVPVIAIDRAATMHHMNVGSHIDPDVDVDLEALRPTAREPVVVRKQRLRSCALSAGNSPTRSPLASSQLVSMQPDLGLAGTKRVLSLGFRADCEKCRLRVPGHMNHFIT